MHPPEERNILVRSQGSAHARGARAVEHRSYTPRDRVRCRPVPHVSVAQRKRAPGCGPGGRGFESLRERCVGFVQVHRGIDQVADRRAHTPEAVGSNPTPATQARVVEPPGRHTGSRGQRASRPMRVRSSPRAPHSRPGGGTTGRHTSLRSWRSRRACEFDSRPGHCDVQVAETVDTPRSKRGALAGVRVRLPPWTTMEGEPARCRRRLEPGGHRQVWGSRPRPTASPRARRRSSARAPGR